MATVQEMCAAYQNVLSRARKYSRNSGGDKDALLADFRRAEGRFVEILCSPEIAKLIDDAIAQMHHLHPDDDLGRFLAEFLTVQHLEDEVRLSCLRGLKTSEVENFIKEVRQHADENQTMMPQLSADILRERFTMACNTFVQSVAASRAMEKRAKRRVKIVSYKVLLFSSMSVISAVVNAPATAVIIGAISFGITGGAIVAAAQYGAELME